MKALVTGARGFIGSHLVEALLKKKYEVRCLLRKKKVAAAWLQDLEIEIVEGDLTRPESLLGAVKDMEYVFHLAGSTKAYSKGEFDKSNFGGTKNLLEATAKANPTIKRFVHVSSLAVGGPSRDGTALTENEPSHPVSNYGRSKLKAENAALAHAKEIPVAIVRPPAVYGPRDKDMFELFKYARRGRCLEIVGGTQQLSMIYVKDLVNGIILAAEKDEAAGQVYYLCNDEVYSVKAVGNLLAGSFRKKASGLKIPLFLVFLLSCGGEVYSKLLKRPSLFSLDKYREIKQTNWICDNSKAKKELGFSVEFSLRDGFKETADWYLTNGWL
ncbi:NAD-dependent epimerase/dehydratase family protein [candidate division KSB1 bacterium]|nr:NAD-dependent epimerase/dehydratase family protein [candidate division KSB1 bacterium]